MKLSFTATQKGTELTLVTKIDSKSKNKIAGTLLNELFQWVILQREVKAQGLKLSQPIGLRFKFGAYDFDSSKISASLQQTLKLQNTPDGMKRFATKFWAILNYVTNERKEITIEELISSFVSEDDK